MVVSLPATVIIEPHQSAVPRDGYPKSWTGKHCCYIYTYETVMNWPPIPTFEQENK